MPRALHPDALLSAAQAAEVDELVAEALQVRQDLSAADAALNGVFVAAAAAAGVTGAEAVDLLGDGRRKPRSQCARPHGLVPPALSRPPQQPKQRLVVPDRRPGAARRHPAAVADAAAMDAATAADDARRDAIRALHATRNRVNERMFRLMYPADRGLPIGQAVDIFGDGLVKSLGEISLPAGIAFVTHHMGGAG